MAEYPYPISSENKQALTNMARIAWRYLMAYSGSRTLHHEPMEGEELKDFRHQCDTVREINTKYKLELSI